MIYHMFDGSQVDMTEESGREGMRAYNKWLSANLDMIASMPKAELLSQDRHLFGMSITDQNGNRVDPLSVRKDDPS